MADQIVQTVDPAPDPDDSIQRHKYTNTHITHIHEYTNTQIHKYTNTQIQIIMNRRATGGDHIVQHQILRVTDGVLVNRGNIMCPGHCVLAQRGSCSGALV